MVKVMGVNPTLNGRYANLIAGTYVDVRVGQIIHIKYAPKGKLHRKGKQWNWAGEVQVKQKEMIIVNGEPIQKGWIDEILIEKETTNSRVPYTPQETWPKVLRYLTQYSPCKASELSKCVGGSLSPSTIGLYFRENPYVRKSREGWMSINSAALLNDGIE